jgi:hypothetical protein
MIKRHKAEKTKTKDMGSLVTIQNPLLKFYGLTTENGEQAKNKIKLRNDKWTSRKNSKVYQNKSKSKEWN